MINRIASRRQARIAAQYRPSFHAFILDRAMPTGDLGPVLFSQGLTRHTDSRRRASPSGDRRYGRRVEASLICES